MSDLNAAEAHLNRAIQFQGGASEAVQLEFLLLRLQSGELEEVTPPLINAVESGNAEAPLILETLARAYMHHLRYKPAGSFLNRWIELQPDAIKAYHWRAWVLERLGNHKGAMVDYLRVLELDPDHAQARTRVAEMLLDDKQAPDAVPHLERLHRQLPNDPVVQARLGACRLLQGRLDEARQLMEAAAARLPGDPALAVALASLDLHEGRGPEAERRLRALLQSEPSDTEALFVLASALRYQGKADEAATALAEYERKKAVVERVNDLITHVADSATATADDHAEIGRLLLDIGRDKLGTYWLDRALEKNPTNQKALRALTEYHERKGDAAAAGYYRRQVRGPEPAAPNPPRPARSP